MKRSFLYVIFSLFLLLLPIGQTTANSNDSIRLSLLTCAPGEVIYTLFGHTAIRYENPSQGIDVVFNYGLFSFDIPNFALRFSLGETDYRLGVIDYPHFAGEYAYFGRSVWQQTLNLTDEEILAIRWHMGAFDDAVRGGSRDINAAYKRSKLAVYLHLADMAATYIDE